MVVVVRGGGGSGVVAVGPNHVVDFLVLRQPSFRQFYPQVGTFVTLGLFMSILFFQMSFFRII